MFEKIKNIIRWRMQRMNIDQLKLSELTGFHDGYITRICNGFHAQMDYHSFSHILLCLGYSGKSIMDLWRFVTRDEPCF